MPIYLCRLFGCLVSGKHPSLITLQKQVPAEQLREENNYKLFFLLKLINGTYVSFRKRCCRAGIFAISDRNRFPLSLAIDGVAACLNIKYPHRFYLFQQPLLLMSCHNLHQSHYLIIPFMFFVICYDERILFTSPPPSRTQDYM